VNKELQKLIDSFNKCNDPHEYFLAISNSTEELFLRFIEDARESPVHKLLIDSGDILLFPNTSFGGQGNVLHGRAELTAEDYHIEVQPGKYMRRVHCRQYLSNRHRAGETSFLKL
jgi:hypothetical protein